MCPRFSWDPQVLPPIGGLKSFSALKLKQLDFVFFSVGSLETETRKIK